MLIQSFNDSILQLEQIVESLGDEESAFGDQLAYAEEQSIAVLSRVNDTLTTYYSIMESHERLASTINRTFLSQLRQIGLDLSDLRSVLTTVLVLASTSEELMNRISNDFVNTQRVIEEILESVAISEIIPVLNMIDANYVITSAIAEELFNVSQILSLQISELNDLVDSTQNHSASGKSAIENIQNTIALTVSISDDLKLKSATLSSTISSTRREMEMLFAAIESLKSMIQQQSSRLPDYSMVQDDLSNLIYNATNTINHTVSDIIPEVETQFDKYALVNRTIGLQMETFNQLESDLIGLSSLLNSSFTELILHEMTAERDLMLAFATLNEAQEIVQDLQMFSNESQSISKDTIRAVTEADVVQRKATQVQYLASNITRDIEEANVDVQSSMEMTASAKNITREAEQVKYTIEIRKGKPLNGHSAVIVLIVTLS